MHELPWEQAGRVDPIYLRLNTLRAEENLGLALDQVDKTKKRGKDTTHTRRWVAQTSWTKGARGRERRGAGGGGCGSEERRNGKQEGKKKAGGA